MLCKLESANGPLEGLPVSGVTVVANERHPGYGKPDEEWVKLDQGCVIHELLRMLTMFCRKRIPIFQHFLATVSCWEGTSNMVYRIHDRLSQSIARACYLPQFSVYTREMSLLVHQTRNRANSCLYEFVIFINRQEGFRKLLFRKG